MAEIREDRLEGLSKAELIAEIRRLRAAETTGFAPATDDADLLRAIVAEAPVAITVKDGAGRYVHANPVASRWFGRWPEDLAGRTAADVMPPATAERIADHDRKVLSSGEPMPFYDETFVIHGDERLVRTTKVPLRDADGAIGWVLTVSMDITELQENEARLRALADRAPFPVYFKDRDARFTIVNEKYQELYGVPAEEALGRTSREIFSDGYGDEYQAEDEYVLESRCVFEREIELGGLPHIAVKFPVIDPNGRLLGLGGIEPDVTRLKEMQTALMLAKETAELANRSKTEFLANMSHELRTPLNSIIGFADLIRAGTIPDPTGERAREYANDIVCSGEHLLTLIGDILDVARIEIGTLPLEEADFDLARLISEGVRMLAVRAPAELELRAHLHVEPIPVRADERRLRQVLINLLSNAVKFTPSGEVNVRTAPTDDGGLSISVDDTGIGIPTEDLERVLAPFSRSDSASIRSREGAGLGLWLAKELTELHDGYLEIDSCEGRGTRVSVFLPPDRVFGLDPSRRQG